MTEKMTREIVLRAIAFYESIPTGQYDDEAVNALRVWLEVEAAPVVKVDECCGHIIIGNEWDDEPSACTPLIGQRVRLVPVGEGDPL